MELTLSPANLDELATLVAPRVILKKPDPDWVKLAEVRNDLFAGKSREWIQANIVSQFPEIQMESGRRGAWIKGVYGRGQVTKIYLPYAKPWMHEHHDEIDWMAK